MANNCKTTGVGPNCSPPEVGDGEKYECLEKEIRRCQGVLNRCIGDARAWPKTTHTFGSVFSGWIIDGASLVATRIASISSCYQTLNCDFRKCYCTDWSCGGFCIEPGVFGPIDKDKKAGTEEDDGIDPDEGPKLGALSVTSSTYERVIERVYGTHIVTGNVFWAGNAFSSNVNNVRLNRSTDLYENLATERYYLSFALGLCAGEIQDVIRIWADDVLIYSRDYTSTASLESGATIDGSAFGIDVSRPYNTTFGQVHVFTGAEDQSPSPVIGDGLAYRGLAYLLFENYDITSLGGRLPTFRVEVVRNVEDVPALVTADYEHDTATTLGDLETDILYVLPTTNIMQLGARGSVASGGRPGLRVAAYDTLEKLRGVVPGQTLTTANTYDLSTFVPMNDKYFAIQHDPATNQRVTSFVRNASPSEMSSFGISAGADNHSTITLANLGLTPYASIFEPMRTGTGSTTYVLFAASGPDLGLYTLDIASGALDDYVLYNDMVSGNISKVVRYREYANLDTTVPTVGDYVSAFAMNAGRNAIEVKRLTLSDSEGLSYFDITQVPVSYTIPYTHWGSVVSGGALKDVIRLSYKDAFLLSITTAVGDYMVLWRPSTGVVWSERVPALPIEYSIGPRMYDFPTEGYSWIGSNNVVYTINLNTGVVTTPPTPAVTCIGAQYFNPLEVSITFISSLHETTKLFLTHKRAAPQSLAAVVSDILIEAGLQEDEIDVSALTDVTLDGYKVNNNSTVAATLAQLGVLYGLYFYSQSGVITANLRARSTPVVLDEDDYEGVQVDIKKEDTYRQLLSVSLTYNSRENEYKDQTQSMRKTQYTRGTEFVEHIVNESHGWPVVMNDTIARAVCERILFADELIPRKGEFVIGPQYVGLSPGDLVDLTIGDEVVTMEITTIVEDAVNLTRKLSCVEIRPELFIEAASVQGVTDFSGRYTSPPIPRPVSTTPIVFPVPPPDHQSVATISSKTAILMVGTDDGAATFVSRDVYYVNGIGTMQLAGTQTGRTLIGTLVTPPVQTISRYSTDHESQMVIQFSHPSVADYLTSYANPNDLLNQSKETNMLIVGREWIQFQTASVGGDGVTVTFTGLHRGLRLTDDAIDGHTVGEMCALYVPGTIVHAEVYLRNEDDVTLDMGITISGRTPDASTFVPIPLIAYNLKAPASPTVRRAGGGTASRQITLVAYHRTMTERDLPDDDRASLTHLNGGATFFAVLKAPYNRELFKQHVQQIYDVDMFATDVIPPDTSYIARFLRTNLNYNHPICSKTSSPYTAAQQATDGVNAYDGDWHFAVFTLDNSTAPSPRTTVAGIPPGYDYVGRLHGYYYQAGPEPPIAVSDTHVGDVAIPALEV